MASKIDPTVGMGATVETEDGDALAATVVYVSPSSKVLTVQRDRAVPITRPGRITAYLFFPAQGECEVYRLTKRGWVSDEGCVLHLGTRYDHGTATRSKAT